MTAFVLALALATQDEPSNLLSQLENRDPEGRSSAAQQLGFQRVWSAIPALIDRLDDAKEDNPKVKASAAAALKRITTKDFGADPVAWTNWWQTEGLHVPAGGLSNERTLNAIRPTIDKLQDQVGDAKKQINISLVLMGLLWVVFLVAILYFSGHLASKLKEWKDVMKQADHYIKASEEITKRTDRILDELESKRAEIMEFFTKLKEDNQGELERFCDLLQQNTEHGIRLEVMALRQKAEKEFTQTVTELKTQIDHELRRGTNEQRETAQRELVSHHQKFLAEIEAHTLYLQGEFLTTHNRREEALKTFKTLVAKKPEHYVGWTSMGNVLRDLARPEEALEAFQRALVLAPTDPAVHYAMAATFASMKKKDAMLQSLAKAFQNDGEFKDEALNDPAFKPFWDDREFKDLAEG